MYTADFGGDPALFVLQSWQLLVAILAVIDFQRTEIQALKELLGKKRILLNDDLLVALVVRADRRTTPLPTIQPARASSERRRRPRFHADHEPNPCFRTALVVGGVF